MGAYHTFDIEIQTDFSLTKDVWDTFDLQRLEESADAANRSELAVVVMQEGLANVCLVTQSLTVVKSKIEATIPKKRRKNHISSHKYDSSLQRFFQAIYNALSVHIDWEKIKVLILASPSNLKEQCLDYMVQYEQELVNNSSGESGRFNLAGHRDAIVLASASSGFKRAVEEILTNPEMQNVIADVGVQHDMVLINEIFERLGRNQDTITYGLDEVQKAAEFGAIETLLICDSLLRTQFVLFLFLFFLLHSSCLQHKQRLFDAKKIRRNERQSHGSEGRSEGHLFLPRGRTAAAASLETVYSLSLSFSLSVLAFSWAESLAFSAFPCPKKTCRTTRRMKTTTRKAKTNTNTSKTHTSVS